MFLLYYFLPFIFAVFANCKSKEAKTESCRKDEALGKVHCLFGEIQGIMKQEALRIKKEKEAFDSVAKKLKNLHFSSTIKMNVGGQLFATSLHTLRKDAGSVLNAMFSGRFDTKPGEDGSYFIDRDGTHFRYILNYLRTGKLILPEDKVLKEEVLEEAKFYQIQEIVDELEPKFYNDSVILNSEQAAWLKNISLHDEGKKFSKTALLYRATRDGWDSLVFHIKCDPFKGPTMVVIKSTRGYIFGGYTEQNWFGSGTYKIDYTAFLFSLVNPEDTAPVQMKVFRNPENAIYCHHEYGPTFGGNHDLLIRRNPQSNECDVNIGHTYELPLGQSSNFLTGGNFKVAEMEIFGLEKD